MLSLFDDEEYVVPPTPKKKEKEEKKEQEEAATPVPDTPADRENKPHPDAAPDNGGDVHARDNISIELPKPESMPNELDNLLQTATLQSDYFAHVADLEEKKPVENKFRHETDKTEAVPEEPSLPDADADTMDEAADTASDDSDPVNDAANTHTAIDETTGTDDITDEEADNSVEIPSSAVAPEEDAVSEEQIEETPAPSDTMLTEDEIMVVAPEEEASAAVLQTADEEDTEAGKTDESNGLPEWHLEDKYYPIGEVAAMFAVNTSHIRFWTTEFKMKTRTTRKGDRLYNRHDIAQLRLIYDLVKVKKYTIKGAKEILKQNKEKVSMNIDLKASLLTLRTKLVEIREQFS